MLDFKYLDEVIQLAQKSDSNALAEIFAATCSKQYALALGWLKDEFRAQDALQACYADVFTNITRIPDGHMAIVFITNSCINACLAILAEDSGADVPGMTVAVEGAEYSMRRLSRLRMSESVCIILRYLCGMSIRQIAVLTEMRPVNVRAYLSAGREALNEKV